MENPLQAFFARNGKLKHHAVADEAGIPLATFRAYVGDKRFPVRARTQNAIERATYKLTGGADAVSIRAWEAYEPFFDAQRKVAPVADDAPPDDPDSGPVDAAAAKGAA